MTTLTSRQRLLTAIQRGVPDRLPVTTHHVMSYFLDKYLEGTSYDSFFDRYELDAIRWILPFRSVTGQVEIGGHGFTCNAEWQIESEDVPGGEYKTTRYRIVTPGGTLTMVMQANEYTAWVSERPVKAKRDIDLIGQFLPVPLCDVEAVNSAAEAFGERGIVRGHIPGFDIFGQPGCWQDAACLFGTQELIMATYDDPAWVHELLGILRQRKLGFIQSLAGARYDILELGGGDASTTVISPRIFEKFVAPYDASLIKAAHEVGQRIVYHTCGGMMPILEQIAAMEPDAMETFTPRNMGGDVDLAKAKQRIGEKVCMIGGFDQFHFFTGCTPAQTRAEVRRCFEAAGAGGGFILSPSDHFFDVEPELISAFADEARKCFYR
ncbi:MAG: hypothetical protein NTW32_14630 [Chloroflexi bacterium]|nr:hypothetical protein [Chloroflexota bacterium]